MTEPLRLAVPNKGRLEAPTARLLREAGLAYERTERTLAAPVRNVDIEILFVRADDVCELVADGVAALGVTGLDLVAESEARLEVLVELDFGHCRLAAAVPSGSDLDSVSDFAGLRVATAHPNVTRRFFDDKGIAITPVPLRGSVEVAPKLGVADAIVDLVSSGSTMRVNGLRQVVTLLESRAALVTAPAGDRIDAEAQRVATMLRAVTAARSKRYVLMNAPDAAVAGLSRLIPGLESPTVVPLTRQGMVSVQSVVDADDLWGLLPALEKAGASGILVLPIQQLIA
jgi:ATP phosphoribosyltransferase